MPLSPKLEWKLKNKLITLILENDGELFGGAARDKYLHDTHATLAYAEMHSILNLNTVFQTHEEMYNNREFRPDLFGRWEIPNDIDVTIHASKYDNFIGSLKTEYPSLKKLFARDPKKYLPNLSIEEGQVRHERYKIDIVNSSDIMGVITSSISPQIRHDIPELNDAFQRLILAMRSVKFIMIDLMVIMSPVYLASIDPPFGNLDFECNSLILGKNGFRVGSYLYEKYNISKNDIVAKANLLTKIFEDIKKKNAVFCYNSKYPWYRIAKMKKKGWKIIEMFKDIESVIEESYEGHCIICTDTLPSKMYKFKCCDARYHPSCMIQAFESGTASILRSKKCIMCKTSFSDAKRDHSILTHTEIPNKYMEVYHRRNESPENVLINVLNRERDHDDSDEEIQVYRVQRRNAIDVREDVHEVIDVRNYSSMERDSDQDIEVLDDERNVPPPPQFPINEFP